MKNISCVRIFYEPGSEDVCFIYYDTSKVNINDIQKTIGEFKEKDKIENILSYLKKVYGDDIELEESLDTICI